MVIAGSMSDRLLTFIESAACPWLCLEGRKDSIHRTRFGIFARGSVFKKEENIQSIALISESMREDLGSSRAKPIQAEPRHPSPPQL